MLVLVPAILLFKARADDPLEALRRTLREGPGITARVVSGGAEGTLEVDAGGGVRVVSGAQRIVHGPEGDWEFDDAAREYDFRTRETPLGRGGIGTGRVADRARALLVPVLLGFGERSGLKTLAFRREGDGYVTGSASERGGGTLTLVFGKDGAERGRLVRGRTASMEGVQEWRISGLKAGRPDPGIFRPKIAPGYVEALEPRLSDAARAGTALPARLAGLAPKAGGAWILAFVGEDARARGWLGKTGLPVSFAEASGAERAGLRIEALPTYFVVGADGKVRGVWRGYAPEMERELEGEWRAALASPKG